MVTEYTKLSDWVKAVFIAGAHRAGGIHRDQPDLRHAYTKDDVLVGVWNKPEQRGEVYLPVPDIVMHDDFEAWKARCVELNTETFKKDGIMLLARGKTLRDWIGQWNTKTQQGETYEN